MAKTKSATPNSGVQGVVVVPTPKFYVTKSRYKSRDKSYGKEVNNFPSMTVPGEAMTLQEIVARYQNGIAPKEVPVSYLDPEGVENVNKYYSKDLDFTDLDELSAAVSAGKKALDRAKLRKRQEELESSATETAASIKPPEDVESEEKEV